MSFYGTEPVIDDGTWLAKYRRRARAICRSTDQDFGFFSLDFIDKQGVPWAFSNGAGAAVARVAEAGGVHSFTTGASANIRCSILDTDTAIWGPFAATQRWYVAARLKVTARPTAADQLIIVGGGSSDLTTVFGANDRFGVGVCGTNHDAAGSDTNFVLMLNDGTDVATVDSGVAVDTTAYHILEGWMDGTLAWVSVDGVTPVSGATTRAPNIISLPHIGIRNAAAAEAHTMTIDWACYGWRIV